MEFQYGGKSRQGGIYKITNLTNGKVYIGSAANFKVRASQHLHSLEKGVHHNKHLQNAFIKYGTDAFLFEVVEVIVGDRLTRTSVEQKYIDSFLEDWTLCYNIRQKTIQEEGPWSFTPEESKAKLSKTMTGRTVSKETKQKLRDANTGKVGPNKGRKFSQEWKDKLAAAKLGTTQSEETRKKRSESLKGHIVSQETRDKLRAVNLGNNNSSGRVVSEETRAKISSSLKGRTHSEESKAKMRGPRKLNHD